MEVGIEKEMEKDKTIDGGCNREGEGERQNDRWRLGQRRRGRKTER